MIRWKWQRTDLMWRNGSKQEIPPRSSSLSRSILASSGSRRRSRKVSRKNHWLNWEFGLEERRQNSFPSPSSLLQFLQTALPRTQWCPLSNVIVCKISLSPPRTFVFASSALLHSSSNPRSHRFQSECATMAKNPFWSRGAGRNDFPTNSVLVLAVSPHLLATGSLSIPEWHRRADEYQWNLCATWCELASYATHPTSCMQITGCHSRLASTWPCACSLQDFR